MQERHSDRNQYYKEQVFTTKKYVIPYLSTYKAINDQTSVLEIGCGEGGNLQPFMEMGCRVTGVDILHNKIQNARNFLEEYPHYDGQIKLIHANIYDVDPETLGRFDIIMMRDVIEHIPRQEVFMRRVKQFMTPGTLFFLGFPPWQMPFGGHQQTCTNKFLAALPYYHLLPQPVYKVILQWGGESPRKIEGLMEVRSTGISIERFRKIVRDENFRIIDETPYLFNPNYDVKFNLKPRKQWGVINSIPYVRNYVTTCSYYILGLH